MDARCPGDRVSLYMRVPRKPSRFQWVVGYDSNRGKTSGRSGCRAGSADEFREVGDGSVSGDIEPGTEIIPEGDAELGAGFGEAEEGIPAVASGIAAGAAADFAFGDVAADVVFGAVGVEWDLRVIEHHQQFGFIGMQPGEQSIEGGKAGLALKDPVEAGAQRGLVFGGRIAAIGFQVAVEPPDKAADALLGGIVAVGEGVELVDQPLGMDPAQPMPADIELSGVVADDHRLGEQTVGLYAAPERAFGGDLHRIGQD